MWGTGGPRRRRRTRLGPPALVAAVVALADGGSLSGALVHDRPLIRSELHPGFATGAALVEPDGLGPTEVVETTASTTTGGAATTVAHATADRIVARTGPDIDAELVAWFANPDHRGVEPVFQVVGPVVDGWVEVRLPIRPNGTTGWVRAAAVDMTTNPYRIDVDVASFRLTVTRGSETVLETTVGIGTGDTPTPHGQFYLTELLRPSDPEGIYGPYAYGLSGFSDALDSFNGGPGIIGIHGTNRPDLLGGNVSHGCVRLDNTVIEELVTFLPLGTPVTID